MLHRDFPNIFFKHPYLELSFAERFAVRLFSAAAYGSLLVITFVFATDQNPRHLWVSLLIALFLADLFIQRFRGEEQLSGYLVEELASGKRLNIARFFLPRTIEIMEKAQSAAQLSGSANLTVHLIRLLSDVPEVDEGLLRIGIDRKEFMQALRDKMNAGPSDGVADTKEIETIAKYAFSDAVALGDTTVSPIALFLGVLHEETSADLTEIFAKFNFVESDFHNAVILGRLARGLGRKMLRRRAAVGRASIPHRIMNRAWTARPTPLLDQYSQDITDMARLNIVGFMVGHENEYRTCLNVLSRDEKNNALLVGPAGVGKSTIVEHLAFQITRDEVPAKLFDRRVVKLSLASLLAGIKNPGDLQQRLEDLIQEVLAAGNIVLYLPDIHVLKTTTVSGLSAFDAFKPIFRASLVPVIGTTGPKEYHTYIESDEDFRALFEKIDVDELSVEDAMTLLTYEAYLLEAKEKITLNYRALRRTVDLAHRFIRTKPLPASAVDLLQEAIAEAKNRKQKVLTEEFVAEVVTRKTRIPVEPAKEQEAEKLLHLEEKLHERLVNQTEAVKAVSSAMRLYRAGLAREKGPIATFLFVGPTGVGKTELSKALASAYFGGESEMIRFDMSQYKDSKSVWNFVGSPDGAVAGDLIEAVKARPYAVLLLDEFEKAHQDITELFLPIFDEGRLSSPGGEVVDFSNIIIIATSNALSEFIKQEVEKNTPFADISAMLKQRLTEYFKPELINRFDGVIVFRQLTPDEIAQIAALQLKTIINRLEDEQGIVVEVAPEVTGLLAKLGWDPVYGARPLRAVIAAKIREPLAEKILKQEVLRGDKLAVKIFNGDIVVEKIK